MSELLGIADDLYALPLGEFTAARDARAKTLKGTDDADLAGPVKALRKPSLAAWVLNVFVRREADQVEQVLALGEALREAQSDMAADELRALTRQRRQLTAAVTQQVRATAREEGVRVTQAVADQVEATLTAAMVDERCGAAVRSGLLVAALATTGVDDADPTESVALPEALGFEATARPSEAPGPSDLHVVPDPDAETKARAAAAERRAEAEEAVARASAAREDAATEVEELRARALQIEAEIDELKRRVADLESDYDDVDDGLGDAEEALTDAEGALAEARAELTRLE